MSPVGWLVRRSVDVPDGDWWLSEAECRLQTRFVVPKRLADWRLGRWTAKAALAAMLQVDHRRVAVAVAPDGAPEALLDDAPVAASLSISHRDGVGLAAVGRRGTVVGVDLELIEPRTDAFVREWFAPEEQALVVAARRLGRADEVACLLWSAKEAVAKVLRAGLRLDPRGGVVTIDVAETDTRWQPSTVDWKTEGRVIAGWWRIEGPLVITIAADPASTVPTELA